MGGQNYKVVSSASTNDLERLAAVVDEKLAPYLTSGRPLNPNALLLAAISLAHELETERVRGRKIADRARQVVERVSGIVDEALTVADRSLGGSGALPGGSPNG